MNNETTTPTEYLSDYPDMLTVAELQELLRIGQRQAYELCKEYDFPSIRIGNSIRIPKQALLEWIATKQKNALYDNPFRNAA